MSELNALKCGVILHVLHMQILFNNQDVSYFHSIDPARVERFNDT